MRQEGWDASRSKQTPFPFTNSVTMEVIASFGEKLWKELIGPNGSTPFKVTHIFLSFSGIGMMETGQRTIEGFLTARSPSDDQQPSVPAIIDSSRSPRKRPRSPSASSSKHEQPEPKMRKDSDQDDTRSTRCAALDENDDAPSNSAGPEGIARTERLSFVCEKCKKRIWLRDAPAQAPRTSRPPATGDADGSVSAAGGVDEGGPVLDDVIIEDALTALRLEHADFHFAQELAGVADEGAPKRVIRPSDRPSTTAKKKQKKKAADEGIAKFFQKR